MARLTGKKKAFRRAAALLMASALLLNDFSYALSPDNRFNPIAEAKIREDLARDVTFVYLNLEIAKFLRDARITAGTGMSPQWLAGKFGEFKARIETGISAALAGGPKNVAGEFEKMSRRFKWREMSLDGAAICLPYVRQDDPDGEPQILRYYIADEAADASQKELAGEPILGFADKLDRVTVLDDKGVRVVLEDPRGVRGKAQGSSLGRSSSSRPRDDFSGEKSRVKEETAVRGDAAEGKETAVWKSGEEITPIRPEGETGKLRKSEPARQHAKRLSSQGRMIADIVRILGDDPAESAVPEKKLRKFTWREEKIDVEHFMRTNYIVREAHADYLEWKISGRPKKNKDDYEDNRTIERYAKMDSRAAPRIVIEEDGSGAYRLWDGAHRCVAAILRGDKTIKAYVGSRKRITRINRLEGISARGMKAISILGIGSLEAILKRWPELLGARNFGLNCFKEVCAAAGKLGHALTMERALGLSGAETGRFSKFVSDWLDGRIGGMNANTYEAAAIRRFMAGHGAGSLADILRMDVTKFLGNGSAAARLTFVYGLISDVKKVARRRDSPLQLARREGGRFAGALVPLIDRALSICLELEPGSVVDGTGRKKFASLEGSISRLNGKYLGLLDELSEKAKAELQENRRALLVGMFAEMWHISANMRGAAGGRIELIYAKKSIERKDITQLQLTLLEARYEMEKLRSLAEVRFDKSFTRIYIPRADRKKDRWSYKNCPNAVTSFEDVWGPEKAAEPVGGPARRQTAGAVKVPPEHIAADEAHPLFGGIQVPDEFAPDDASAPAQTRRMIEFTKFACRPGILATAGAKDLPHESFEIALRLPYLQPVPLRSLWSTWLGGRGYTGPLPNIGFEHIVQVSDDETYIPSSIDNLNITLCITRKKNMVDVSVVPQGILAELRHKAFYYKFMERIRNIKEGEDIYVSFGDIDHLHKVNQVMGKSLTNQLLYDISMSIMDDMLDESAGWYHQFGGDETRIISPSGMSGEEVMAKLDGLRRKVHLKLRRRYGVIALNLIELKNDMRPDDFTRLCAIARSSLIFEENKHRGKCLGLFYYFGSTMPLDAVAEEALKNINGQIGKEGLKKIDGQIARLEGHVEKTFNHGYMWGPTLSGGVVSVRQMYEAYAKARNINRPLNRISHKDAEPFYNAVIGRTEVVLEKAKEERNSFLLDPGGDLGEHKHGQGGIAVESVLKPGAMESISRIKPDPSIPAGSRDFHDSRYRKDSAFRSEVYRSIGSGHKGTLVEIECVYGGDVIENGKTGLGDKDLRELRGDNRGVGMRAINRIAGHNIGDLVIRFIANEVASAIPASWRGRPGSPRAPPLGRIVDRCSIYMEDRTTDEVMKDLENYVYKVQEGINSRLKGIDVKVKASIADSEGILSGGLLSARVEYTSLVKPEHFDDDKTRREVLIPLEKDNIIHRYSPAVDKIAPEIQEEKAYIAEKVLELNCPEGAHLRVRRAAILADNPYDFGEIVNFTGITDDDTITIEFKIAGRKSFKIGEAKDSILLLGRGGIALKLRDQIRWLELSGKINADPRLRNLGKSNLKEIYHNMPITEFSPTGDPHKIAAAAQLLKEGFLDKIEPGQKIAVFFHHDADGMSAAKLLELFLREYTSERENLSLASHKAAPAVEYYNVPSTSDRLISEKKAAGCKTVVVDMNLQKDSRDIDLVIDHHLATDELCGNADMARQNPGMVVITPRTLGMGDFYATDDKLRCRLCTTGNIMRPLIKEFFGEYKAALFDSRYGWLAAISLISEGLEPQWRKYAVLYDVCKMLNRIGGLSEEDALLGLETINSFITEDPSYIEKLYARFAEVMDLITPVVRRIYKDTEGDPYVIYFLRRGEIQAPQKLGRLMPAHAVLFELIDMERESLRKRPIFIIGEGEDKLYPFCQQPYGDDESGAGRPDLGRIMEGFGGGGLWHSGGVRVGVDIEPGRPAEEAFAAMKAKIEATLSETAAGAKGIFNRETVENVLDYFTVNFNTPEFAAVWDSVAIGPSNAMFSSRLGNALDAESPSVLDLGTGTGKALLPIASRMKGGNLVGVDMNEAMINYARAKFDRAFPHLNKRFLSGDVHELDRLLPEGERFDGVTARLLVNFIDTNKVFPQVYGRLKPGGRFVFNIFAGNFYGDNDDLARSNPFYVALKESFRKVLEEEIPKLPPDKIRLLIDGRQIEMLPDGTCRIIGDAVTQHKGLDRASLESALRSAGFEDISFEPVPEMYPVVDKRKSALLTKSIPFFWGVTNVVFKGDTGKRIEIIQKAYDAVPERFRSGDILATDVFISCAKPKSIDRAAAAGATTGPLHSYMPNSRPRGIDIAKDTAGQLFGSLGRDASSPPLDINWIGIRPVSAGTCPLKCVYCDQSRVDPGMAVPFDKWKDLVRTVTLDGARRGVYLDISGGEPALWGRNAANLLEFIKYAKSLGMIVVLSSNGALIDETLAGQLALSGLDNISISLDSHEKAVHDSGRPFGDGWKKVVGASASSFECALRAMKLIDAARRLNGSALTITVNTVITNRNYNDFIEFIDFVGQNTPANDINICPVKDDKYSGLFLDLDQIRRWEKDILPKVEELSARYGFKVIPKKAKELFGGTDEERLAASRGAYFIRSQEGHSCFTALTSLYVDYNGRAFACSYGADHVDDRAVHLGVLRDFNYDVTKLRTDPDAVAKINSVPGMSASDHSTCNKFCGRDVARTNNNVRKEFAALVNAAYAGLSGRMTPLLLELSRNRNVPLYRILSDGNIEAPASVPAEAAREITEEALARAELLAQEYGFGPAEAGKFLSLLPVMLKAEVKDGFIDDEDAVDLVKATLILSRVTGRAPAAVFAAACEFLKNDTGLTYAPVEMYLWAYRFYAQEIAKRASKAPVPGDTRPQQIAPGADSAIQASSPEADKMMLQAAGAILAVHPGWSYLPPNELVLKLETERPEIFASADKDGKRRTAEQMLTYMKSLPAARQREFSRFAWKTEEELEKKIPPDTYGLEVWGFPGKDESRYIFRGQRLPVGALIKIAKKGIHPEDNPNYTAEDLKALAEYRRTGKFLYDSPEPINFAADPGVSLPHCFYSTLSKVPEKDFVSVLFRIDKTRNPEWEQSDGFGNYATYNDVPLEWIDKIFLYDKEDGVFCGFTPAEICSLTADNALALEDTQMAPEPVPGTVPDGERQAGAMVDGVDGDVSKRDTQTSGVFPSDTSPTVISAIDIPDTSAIPDSVTAAGMTLPVYHREVPDANALKVCGVQMAEGDFRENTVKMSAILEEMSEWGKWKPAMAVFPESMDDLYSIHVDPVFRRKALQEAVDRTGIAAGYFIESSRNEKPMEEFNLTYTVLRPNTQPLIFRKFNKDEEPRIFDIGGKKAALLICDEAKYALNDGPNHKFNAFLNEADLIIISAGTDRAEAVHWPSRFAANFNKPALFVNFGSSNGLKRPASAFVFAGGDDIGSRLSLSNEDAVLYADAGRYEPATVPPTIIDAAAREKYADREPIEEEYAEQLKRGPVQPGEAGPAYLPPGEKKEKPSMFACGLEITEEAQNAEEKKLDGRKFIVMALRDELLERALPADVQKAQNIPEPGRPVIVALGTGWIKGCEAGADPRYRGAINDLVREIRQFCADRKISFVDGKEESLASAIELEREKEGYGNAKVVVLADAGGIKKYLASLAADPAVFMAGVDSSELAFDSNMLIPKMLLIAMRLAFGKDINLNDADMAVTKLVIDPSMPAIYLFIPHAVRVRPEELRLTYDVKAFA